MLWIDAIFDLKALIRPRVAYPSTVEQCIHPHLIVRFTVWWGSCHSCPLAWATKSSQKEHSQGLSPLSLDCHQFIWTNVIVLLDNRHHSANLASGQSACLMGRVEILWSVAYLIDHYGQGVLTGLQAVVWTLAGAFRAPLAWESTGTRMCIGGGHGNCILSLSSKQSVAQRPQCGPCDRPNFTLLFPVL